MPARLWSFNDLARFLRFEDPEVRYWAADRLARHYGKEATDVLAPYLFDEHDLTPELVASHLGRHGSPAHLSVLTRGARTLRGSSSARALEALVRLRAPDSIDLVHQAFDRRDYDEECWSFILEALAERGDDPARRELQAFLKKRADWFGSPPILRSALNVTGPGEYRPALQAWLRSLQWRGAGGGGAGDSFRVLMDHLEIDDCGWCFRTELSGRIDFARTLKAVESSYDCEVRAALGDETCARIAAALMAGAFESSAATLSGTILEQAGPALLVEIAPVEGGPRQVDRLRGAQPHQGLERARRRHATLRPGRPHQLRHVRRRPVAPEVPGHQLGGQFVIIEQVGGEEIGRLVGMVPRQPLGRPVADLGVFVAQEARQILERPETFAHRRLVPHARPIGIIADRPPAPHPTVRGDETARDVLEWRMAERGGFEPPTPVLAGVTA